MSSVGRKGETRHGTFSAYCNAGCRCEACRKAAARYGKSRRLAARRAALPSRPGRALGRGAIGKALEDTAVLYMGAGRGLEEVPMPEISAGAAKGLEALAGMCA